MTIELNKIKLVLLNDMISNSNSRLEVLVCRLSEIEEELLRLLKLRNYEKEFKARLLHEINEFTSSQ